MFLLAITTDDKLVNQLKAMGQVMKCISAEMAAELINSGEFDAVVLGTPYTDIDIKTLKHDNVIVVKTRDDLTKFLISKQKPANFPNFSDGISEEPVKSAGKLRGVEPKLEEVQVNPKDLGRVLLVTTNMELVKYLIEFDLRIATTRYSATKALSEQTKIVIWNIDEKPMETPKVLLYKWGDDLRHQEDIIQVLSNTDL